MGGNVGSPGNSHMERGPGRIAAALALIWLLSGLAGCGQRWPISAEHAKAVVRTYMTQECTIVKLTVGRVTDRNSLALGHQVYPVTVTFTDALGERSQVWAVDAVTGQGYFPDRSYVNPAPVGRLGE
jgi:hypothetical protein